MKVLSILSAKAILLSIMAIAANADPGAEPQELATAFGNCKDDGGPCTMPGLKDCCPGLICWNHERVGNRWGPRTVPARCVGLTGFFQCVIFGRTCQHSSDCCKGLYCNKPFKFQPGICR